MISHGYIKLKDITGIKTKLQRFLLALMNPRGMNRRSVGKEQKMRLSVFPHARSDFVISGHVATSRASDLSWDQAISRLSAHIT